MNTFRTNRKMQIMTITIGFALICFIYALIIEDIPIIISGLKAIMTSKCGLITDYFVIGGMGATLVNCGLTTLFCLGLYLICKAKLDGLTIAVIFTVAGFSFFGKNLLNVLPIILGAFLFCLVFNTKFKSIIHIALLSTSLAPVVTESYFILDTTSVILNISMALTFGILIGFITPQIAQFTPKCHQGYQLYNVGFAAGIVGMVLTAIMNFFNHYITPQTIYSTTHTNKALILILILSVFFIILALMIDVRGLKGIIRIIRHQAKWGSDYTEVTGLSSILFNMAMLGLVYTSIILLIGCPISGPIVGGILTIVGFSAYGKNIFNTIFIACGVIIFAEIGHINLDNISVALALLFGTCLAPIVNKYGAFLGIVAGAFHVCLVMNVSMLHSGLNLYNNGFAAGLICIFLIPLFDAIIERFPNSFIWLNIDYFE